MRPPSELRKEVHAQPANNTINSAATADRIMTLFLAI
jgi:hypothetical protein